MYPHIEFWIPTSNNIGDMLWTLLFEVKVTVTKKLYVTLRDSKMHPHTEFGIPTSNNIGKMLTHTQDRQCDYYMPPFGRIKKNWGFIKLDVS